MDKNKKILIYGEKFNPPNYQHILIFKKLINLIKPDLTIIFLNNTLTYEENILIPYSYRKQMLKNLCLDCKIKFKFYPNKLNFSSTFQTFKLIQKEYKNNHCIFLTNYDEYFNFKKKQKNNQCNHCLIDSSSILNEIKNFQLINLFVIKNKSEIFSIKQNNYINDYNEKIIGKKNLSLIEKKHLYLQYKIKNKLPKKRYLHTLRVLFTISKFAYGNNFTDSQILQAQIAAILHDVAKYLPEEKIKKMLTQKQINSLPSIHCGHGIVGKEIAKNEFKINDKVILNAIANHVICHDHNKITKALFCADKLEPKRTNKDIYQRKKLFDECINNLDKIFKIVIKLNGDKY